MYILHFQTKHTRNSNLRINPLSWWLVAGTSIKCTKIAGMFSVETLPRKGLNGPRVAFGLTLAKHGAVLNLSPILGNGLALKSKTAYSTPASEARVTKAAGGQQQAQHHKSTCVCCKYMGRALRACQSALSLRLLALGTIIMCSWANYSISMSVRSILRSSRRQVEHKPLIQAEVNEFVWYGRRRKPA